MLNPGQLQPPINVTFGMNGNFCLFWKWTPVNNTANCPLRYKAEILTPEDTPPGWKNNNPYYTKFFNNKIDLNGKLTLKISTECDNRTSEVKQFTSPVAPGNPRAMVRNMNCVWYYKEYMNCTWHPGEHNPPNVNYSLHYWLTEDITCPPVGNKQPTPLHDLLDKGELCQNYTYQRGTPVGCLFRLEKDYKECNYLVAVVTDRNQDVKPYIYFHDINTIAKLKAPVIHVMKRTPNNSLFVSWTIFDIDKYEVQLNLSNGDTYKIETANSKEIPNALPHVAYTAKVRVRLHPDALSLQKPTNENFLWSEWSEERTLQEDNDGVTFIFLLLLVPVVIILITIILLMNIKRVLIIICPQVPDPSKVISKDIQYWLKYGKPVYNEPKKEEVCVVSLLETSPLSFQVE
ncbi:interleukin-13 receptor subunit alpha-1-like isoform 2-T2 [Anomaloglossus baeobatrachus]|uniref:interleukin-13 receptor subunit alpha-1-like isoform X2 n=1 Tax=Anomaloglossus baeobatrachus TaxID=238106 RepID=UPI003F5004CC